MFIVSGWGPKIPAHIKGAFLLLKDCSWLYAAVKVKKSEKVRKVKLNP